MINPLPRSIPSHAERSRSGIALVIVLGMLAIMVLMGVAFSISMRTERLAASAYVDIVTARNLMDAALGRVVSDHIPEIFAFYDEFYPSWPTDPPAAGASGDNFMIGKGINYVPGILRDAAREADILDWTDIRDPDTGRFYGQYAYMVVNNSGLLDANAVMSSNRNYGAGPEEIQAVSSIFDEISAASDANLGEWRDQWFTRFETVPELHALGAWVAPISGQSPPFLSLPSYVDHFHVFSHYPNEDFIAPTGDPLTFPKANVAGSHDEWDDDATIIEILTQQPNPPFASPEAAEDFLNILKDYTRDGPESYFPENVGGLSFTRVPMINEVVVSNTFARSPAADFDPMNPEYTFSIRIHVAVETWYPFSAAPGIPAFSVQLASPPQLFEAPQFPGFAEWNSNMQEGPTQTPAAHSGGPDDYRVWRFTYESQIDAFDWAFFGTLAAFPVRILIEDNIDVVLGGRPVNRVNGTWPQNTFQAIIPAAQIAAILPDGNFVPLGQPVSVQANDPRLNWDPSDALTAGGQWFRTQPPTLGPDGEGAPNVDRLDGPDDEVNQLLYCAHRPLQSVGELSYLLHSTNNPWSTVRILGPDPDNTSRVIDRLKIHDEPARRGLVNINSAYIPVLQSAIYRAPIEVHRNAVGSRGSATVDEALNVATIIRDDIADLPSGARNLSDLSQLPNLTITDVSTILGLASPRKFEAESIIRNSLGMMGTRDTLYTVFLITRTFPRGYDPDPSLSEIEVPAELGIEDLVAAEQRAVALVWRDPALVNNANRTIVRSFIWLTEEN